MRRSSRTSDSMRGYALGAKADRKGYLTLAGGVGGRAVGAIEGDLIITFT
jgi:hypothetical protein